MQRSLFFKLFTIVGFMFLPSLAFAADKQFVGISCDGTRTLQVVAEAKTDKQLIAGSDFQFTQYDEEAIQFSFFGDVFKVDRNTGSMSVNNADAMAGLSCDVETLKPFHHLLTPQTLNAPVKQVILSSSLITRLTMYF